MSKAKTKQINSLGDLQHDDRNANKGSDRGRALMADSLTECGFGDSLTVDRNGKIISGNKRNEKLEAAGLIDPIIVQSDGTRPIIHQRVDLDLDVDDKAKKLALYLNRVGELN